MDKPPYAVRCSCCKLPAFYTYEKIKITTNVYCAICNYAMLEFTQTILQTYKYKSPAAVNEDYNQLRSLIGEDYQLLNHLIAHDGIYHERLSDLINKNKK